MLGLAQRMRRLRPLGQRSAVTAAIGVGLPALVGARIDTRQHAGRCQAYSEPGTYLRIDGGSLLALKNGDELLSVPLEKVDQVLASDEGAVSFAVLRALLARGATCMLQGVAARAYFAAFAGLLPARTRCSRMATRCSSTTC